MPAAASGLGKDEPGNIRFSAKSLASQRRRLGLSAAQCGLLLGASDQSVHNWQNGKTRLLAKHLPAIAALRGMSKKDAAARVGSLQGVTALIRSWRLLPGDGDAGLKRRGIHPSILAIGADKPIRTPGNGLPLEPLRLDSGKRRP